MALVCLTSDSAAAQQAAPAAGAPVARVVTERPSTVPGTLLVERDTPVRLMVVNEVTTKTAHQGDRFILRVDEDVLVGGTKVIPVGSRAWGEVVAASESGALGKAGKLAARLLYVEAPGGRVDLKGDATEAGPGGAGATVLGVLGLGPLGLLTRGTNAKLKAGDIFNGHLSIDLIYDPGSRSLRPAPVGAQPIAIPDAR